MLNYKNEKKIKKTITVFYHLFIPDTNNMWIWWVDEQMGLLKSSGLVDEATINMCITLPLNLYNSKMNYTYDQMVIEYIKDRFPFVNIIDIRNTNESTNLYEGQTLLKLYEYCLTNNGYVFYFHNKGMTSYSSTDETHIPGAIKDWRHYMQYFNIELWKNCVYKLEEGYDYVSVDEIEWDYKFGFLNQPKYNHLMGNFWWSTTNYIKNLGNPLNIVENYEKAIHQKISFSNENDFKQFCRLSFELWIHLNKPKCFYTHNSNVNNYSEYYPRKNYCII